MNTNFARWPSPILGQDAETVYTTAYGDKGIDFLRVLETSPYEIAVVSRLIVYMQRDKQRDINSTNEST